MDNTEFERALLELTSELLCVVGVEGYFHELNSAWVKLLGYSLDELRSRPFESFVHPEDRARTHIAIREFMRTGEAWDFENRYIAKDGSIRHICWSSARVLHGDHLLVLGRDVTEARQAEQGLESKLIENERKYRLLAENATDIISMQNRDTVYTYVSPAIQRILGYEPEEVIGKTPFTILHPDDEESYREHQSEVYGKRGTHFLSARYRKKAGGYLALDSTSRSVLDPRTGLATGIICVSRDATERKGAELRIRNQAELLTTVLNSVPLALYCKDARNEMRYTFWNRKAEELLALPSEKVLGKTDEELFSKSQVEAFRRGDLEALCQAKVIELPDFSIRSGNQEVHLVRSSKVPVRGMDGMVSLVVGVIEDITDQKHAESVIEEQRLKIIANSKMSALGEMAGGVAHEINNPLAIISGRASLLKTLVESHELDADKVVVAADKIIATTHRIAKIIRGLRTFSRDSSRDPFERVHLRSIIDDTLELCANRFRNHGVDLTFKNEPGPGFAIECRGAQVSQVLLNLLNNAFDAVVDLPERWVRLDVREAGESVEFRVTDSGHGIPIAVQERIFQPFFTTKQIGKGTGLGLSITQGILAEHGGRIYVDQRSKHTCFVAVLPKVQQKIAVQRAVLP
jgi:PAS domain S-box-containing protein